MTPDPTTTTGQGEMSRMPQPLSDVFISPATQRLLGIRMESTGAPAQTTAPTGAEGGQGQNGNGAQPAGGGGGFNWELFPTVPEEQRSLLEPHIRNVQGHVTKLEQQYSPYKGVIDSGISADDLNGLVQLNKAFGEDPMGTWLKLAADMQANKLLSDDLDLDAVKLVLEGKAEVDDGTGEGGVPAGEGEQEPQWARELRQELEQSKQAKTQSEQEAVAQQQQQQLDQTLGNMKTQLKEAGFTDEQINGDGFEDLLTSAIITAKGNPDAALQQILTLRDASLKGLTGKPNGKSDEGGDLEMNGTPKTPTRSRGGREFAKAREGAAQFLTRQNQAASE